MNLTKRSYILAVIIISFGIIGEWGHESLQGLWRLPAAACIILFLLEGYFVRKIQFELQRDIPQRIHLGEKTLYSLSTKNSTHRTIELRTLDTYPAAVVEEPNVLEWTIEPEEKQEQQCHFTPTRLGKITWHTFQTRILGQFGLAWWSRNIRKKDQVTVIPTRLQSNEYKNVATAHQGNVNRHVTGTGHELMGMRDYQQGDPLHFIDWKATARSQRPTVRLFSQEQHLELILVIDAGRTSGM